MSWEETSEYVRSGHINPEEFDKGSFRTIEIDPFKGIKALSDAQKATSKMGNVK